MSRARTGQREDRGTVTRLGRTIRVLAMAALLAGATVVAAGRPAWAAPSIQPGEKHTTDGVACVLNFVFDGTGSRQGKVYIATAGHCLTTVGQDIALEATGEVFGDVAVIGGSGNQAATDWGLIEVRPDFHGRVSPAMKGHGQYPTGVTSPGQTSSGDKLQLTGSRQLSLVADDDAVYRASAMGVVPGDSGGPLGHAPTRRALGVVSTLDLLKGELTGPTIQGVVAKANAAGFPVKLRTV